jgi:Domain of unknown function (DUF1707)
VGSGPWDPTRPGTPGRNRFLASDADRDRVVEALKAAFVHGALSRDELSARTGRALASRTYGELAALTAGLGPGTPRAIGSAPLARPRPSAPARAWKRVNKKVVAWTAVALVLPFVLGASFLSYYGGFLVMFGFTFLGAVLMSRPPNPRRPGRPG